MAYYIITLIFNLMITLATFITLDTLIKYPDAFSKFTSKKRKLVGVLIGVCCSAATTIVYFATEIQIDILYLILAHFAAVAVYVFILREIGYKNRWKVETNRKMFLKQDLEAVLKKYPEVIDAMKIVEIFAFEFDKHYFYKDVEQVMNELEVGLVGNTNS